MRILYFIAALFIFAPAAQAEYLQDLTAPPQERLGSSFPGSSPAYFSAISDGGMGVVRLSATWEHREPTPGQYEWAGLDRQIIRLQSLGLEPFLTFESNAEWAVRPETSTITNGTPINMADWTTFVSLVVDRYNADGWEDAPGLLRPIRYYQALNEWDSPNSETGGWLGTDQELVAFLNATHDAVKAQQPTATFVLGGLTSDGLDILVLNRRLADYEIWYRSGPDAPFVKRPASRFRASGYDAAVAKAETIIAQMTFDAVDLHLYGPPGRDPIRIQAVRNIVGNVPLLSAECGGPSMHYQDYDPEDHFMAVIERNLIDLSEGLEFCLWYRLGEGKGTSFGNGRTALFDDTLAEKPGYHAYKMLSYILQEMTSVERGAGNSFTIHRTDKPPLVVAWLEEGQSSKWMVLPEDIRGSVMTVTDPIRGIYEIEPVSGFGAVLLSKWPMVAGELP